MLIVGVAALFSYSHRWISSFSSDTWAQDTPLTRLAGFWQMDSFQGTKRDRSPTHEHKITADERAKALKCGNFYADGGRLFCRPCGQMVNHVRKSTIDTHCVSQKHIRNVCEDPQGVQHGSPGMPPSASTSTMVPQGVSMKQRSLISNRIKVKAREKTGACREFACLLGALDMPVCGGTGAAAIAGFVRRRLMSGGIMGLPDSDPASMMALVPSIYEEVKEEVFDKLKNKQIAIQMDETTDANDEPVINILMADISQPIPARPPMLGPAPTFYLCNTTYLDENPTSGKIGKIVIESLKEYDIDLDQVLCFHTDNETYMVKAYQDILSPLLPNCMHLTCLSDLTQVIGEAIAQPFTDLHHLVKDMGELLNKSGGRRARFLRYLKNVGKDDLRIRTSLPPTVKPDDWVSWHKAVVYHSFNCPHYLGFLEQEFRESSNPSPAISQLKKLYAEPDRSSKLVASARFLAATTSEGPLHALTDAFESGFPDLLRCYDLLELVKMYLSQGPSAGDENNDQCEDDKHADESYITSFTKDLSLSSKSLKELQVVFENALKNGYKACTEFLSSSENLPGVSTLKGVRAFDPNHIASIIAKATTDQSTKTEDTIAPKSQWEKDLPVLHNVNYGAFELYKRYAYGDTSEGQMIVQPDLFWHTRGDELGVLGQAALALSSLSLLRTNTGDCFTPYRHPTHRGILSHQDMAKLAFLQRNLTIDKSETFDLYEAACSMAGGGERVFPGGYPSDPDDRGMSMTDDIVEHKPIIW